MHAPRELSLISPPPLFSSPLSLSWFLSCHYRLHHFIFLQFEQTIENKWRSPVRTMKSFVEPVRLPSKAPNSRSWCRFVSLKAEVSGENLPNWVKWPNLGFSRFLVSLSFLSQLDSFHLFDDLNMSLIHIAFFCLVWWNNSYSGVGAAVNFTFVVLFCVWFSIVLLLAIYDKIWSAVRVNW